ncbi:MAG: carboxypeptidase-like regulatory domain-containing protein [Saprospiraceae bacterium]
MKNLLRFLLMLISFALFSCDKEDDLSITDDVYTPPVIAIKGSIAGMVINENGNPVAGVTVRVGSEQKQTDPGGYFIFRNITLDANGTFIKVDERGYFQASRRFYPKANAMNYTTLTLMYKINSGQVDATTGGTVNVPGGGGTTVKLPANGVAKPDGTLYTGQVLVAARWLNPTAGNLTDIMPGNLQAINDRREEVALATYGMIAVELTEPDGSPLNLASGSKAELTFPIPSQLQSSAPSEIPLWHFDETTGLWREEGFAIRQGNVYVGEVSHFSFWNCDAPFPLINIEGTVLSPDGNQLAGIKIHVNIVGSTVTGSGSTDSNGYFKGKMPAGELLLLEAIDPCGQLLISQNIGPFTNDTNIGNLTVASGSTVNYTNFSGTIVNCDEEPVTNGILQICQDDVCYFTATEADGSINTFRLFCNSNDFTITAYDMYGIQQSAAQTFANAETINIGNFVTCSSQIAEYLSINIDGENNVYPFPYAYSFSGQPGALQYVSVLSPEDSTYSVHLTFPQSAPGTYTGAGVEFRSFQLEPALFWGECLNPCSNMTITVTEFGSIGNFIRGTFSGNADFRGPNQQQFPNLPVSGEFAVIRTQ